MPALHDTPSLERLASEHRLSPHELHRLATLVLKRGVDPEEALAALPRRLPSSLVEQLSFGVLRLEKRVDSTEDGATKLLLRTAEGIPLECVLLRIASGRTTLCLSVQSGCPVRCTFCASGLEGKRADLSVDEVLDQLVMARRIADGEERRIRNLVFMGMGEPLLAEGTLHEVLRRLVNKRAFAFPPTRIAISTIGLPRAMVRLVDAFPEIRLALSLHSARQEVREELIPLARPYPLKLLRAAVREIGRRQAHRVMIEYLLLEGRTDRSEDLDALRGWLEGLRVHLNLIPYNPLGPDDPLRPTPRPERERIASIFRAEGLPCTLRRSLGGGVLAGCGQLASDAS